MKLYVSGAVMLVALLAGGCSSTMQVPPGVINMSKGMSEQQARQVVAQMLTPQRKDDDPAHLGICKIAPFEISVDYKKGADLKVDDVGVTFNALRQERNLTAAGIAAGAVTALATRGASSTVSAEYSYTPFRDVHRFDNIDSIRIKVPSKLTSVCFPDDGQSEVFIQEASAMGHWYAALIPTKDKERFIAAWLRIKPNVKLVE